MAVSYTTTYNLTKPEVGASEDEWGGLLNTNLDELDNILDGTTPVTGIDINSGTIDGTVIGGSTAAAGSFTTLSASTSITGTLATAAQTNITSVGTLTGFTSTGIDDNATSTAITIDSSENVGIGTSSPSALLHLDASSDGRVARFGSGASDTGGMYVTHNSGGTRSFELSADNILILDADRANGRASSRLQFNVDGSERMRIDSSGNLLVGKTSAGIANIGFEAQQNGNISATREGTSVQPTLRLNKLTNDGSILRLDKDGSTVGSIGYISSGLYIDGEGGHAGLRFGGADISPRDGGADADAAIQLGSSSNRFTDLYLSGGVYLGGTGSANKLDDYEEGTWTPTFVPESGSFSSLPYSSDSRFGRYTIIGNRCYFEIKLQTSSSGVSLGTASGDLYVDLPFTARNVTNYATKAAAAVSYSAFFDGQKNPMSAGVISGTSSLFFWHRSTETSVPSKVTVSDVSTSVGGTYNRVRVFGHYELA